MNYILNIDTTSENAIVNVSNGPEVIATATNSSAKEHASFLHVAIHKLLDENAIAVSELKAVGVAGGPGSYTGIRVGLATAKGLCFALNIPLMMYNTLELMAFSCIEIVNDNKAFYCPMIDARRMEVFTAVYDAALSPVIAPAAMELTEETWLPLLEKNKIYFFGSGAEKARNLIRDPVKNFHLVTNSLSSESLARFGWDKFIKKNFVNLVYSKPLYLKEFYTTAKLA